MAELPAHPQVGLGPIRLGISRAQAIALLGEPSHREKLSFIEDETTEYFEYDELELELGFSTDDGDRLGVIRCGSDTLRLHEQAVIGEPIAEFLTLHPGFEKEEEAADDGTEDYSDESQDLSITVARGRIVSLSLFPAWSEEDEPIWPAE